MIFVTVGAQMPFDRMIKAIDEWAAQHPNEEILAQVGESEYRPKNLKWENFLRPSEFKEAMQKAGAVVAHAGTGSIINALEFRKPILVMPRRADLLETRNDHQIATAERFQAMKSIAVAFDEDELAQALTRLSDVQPGEEIESHASSQLLDTIRDFVLQQN